MKICIYDLSARYEVQVWDFETKEVLFSSKLPPALIKKDDKHSNRRFSFFEPENPDFSCFIDFKADNGLNYKYDNNRLITLTEIMYSLCFSNEYNDEIENYFKGVRKLVAARFMEKEITVDETIILVPDALNLSSQERLLSYFGRYKTRLLWHSMAIALGMEKELFEEAEEGMKIALVDEFSDIGTFCSKIEIKKEGNRAIPCHKIYMKSIGLNRKWYMKDQEHILTDNLESKVKMNRLSASYRQVGFNKAITFDSCNHPKEHEVVKFSLPSLRIENASLIIASTRAGQVSVSSGARKISTDVATQAYEGAVRFVDYVARGLVPYYDECEPFSVVCQNSKEELQYFELVKGDSYLPGGRKMEGNVIDTLFIPKGSKHADFYFHLGAVENYDAQLKLYSQEFPIDEPLKDNRRLRLSPSVIPGQGYAQIVIEDYEQQKLFSPIELDWKNMKSAFNKKGQPVTVRILEQDLERSFPPDVPPVRSRYAAETSGSVMWTLRMLIEKKFCYDINNSIWPNINDYSKGVERFVRQNTFGSYVKGEKNDYRFPKVPGIRNEEYIEVFKWAACQYLNGQGGQDYLKYLAWSYLRYDLDGRLIPEITKVTEKVIKELKSNVNFTCPAVHASYIANMIVTEREFEEIFLRFKDVLRHKKVGIGHWCRAMYQLLMYTPFIYSKNENISGCATYCMKELVAYLNMAVGNGKWNNVDNILRVMLYLLKRRVIDKSFYKEEFQPVEYQCVVEALKNAKTAALFDKFIVQTVESIIKYMDGKGALDGIPSPLLGN